jgi:hypothetical protein
VYRKTAQPGHSIPLTVGFEQTYASVAKQVAKQMKGNMTGAKNRLLIRAHRTLGMELAEKYQDLLTSVDLPKSKTEVQKHPNLALWQFELRFLNYTYNTDVVAWTDGSEFPQHVPACFPGYCDNDADLRGRCCQCKPHDEGESVVYEHAAHCAKHSCTHGDINLVAGNIATVPCDDKFENKTIQCTKNGTKETQDCGTTITSAVALCIPNSSLPRCFSNGVAKDPYRCMAGPNQKVCSKSHSAAEMTIRYSNASCCDPGSCRFEKDEKILPVFADQLEGEVVDDVSQCQLKCCETNCRSFMFCDLRKACTLNYKPEVAWKVAGGCPLVFYKRQLDPCDEGQRVEAKFKGMYFPGTIRGKTSDNDETLLDVEWDDWDTLLGLPELPATSRGLRATEVRKGSTLCSLLEPANTSQHTCKSSSDTCGFVDDLVVEFCTILPYCLMKPGEERGKCAERDFWQVGKETFRARTLPVVVLFYNVSHHGMDAAAAAEKLQARVAQTLNKRMSDLAKELHVRVRIHGSIGSGNRTLELVAHMSEDLLKDFKEAMLPNAMASGVPEALRNLLTSHWNVSRGKAWILGNGSHLMHARNSGFALHGIGEFKNSSGVSIQVYFAEFRDGFGSTSKLAHVLRCGVETTCTPATTTTPPQMKTTLSQISGAISQSSILAVMLFMLVLFES